MTPDAAKMFLSMLPVLNLEWPEDQQARWWNALRRVAKFIPAAA